MRTLILPLLFLSVGFRSLSAQEIGVPFTVDLPETSTTLTLDFSKCDYELILYSIDTHLENQWGLCSPLAYSVTAAFGASNPVPEGSRNLSPQVSLPDRVSLESLLRAQERELARRLQESGGYRPHAAKVVPQKIGSTRQFVFPSIGDAAKATITANLVATGERANAYADAADVGRMNRKAIQAQVDRFSETTYPMGTSTFGSASDVDNDGKIHFLYSNRVNPDGSAFGAAGFFHAASLLAADQGGDGNLSDMFYIDPDTEPEKMDALLAHEFQHLINFNQHVLLRNGQSEDSWLNEGLSHFSEDLIGEYDAYNNPSVDIFLRYSADGPLGTTVHTGQKSRGAAYLFLRSLVQEFGSEILPRLVQTGKAGFANVESATGRRFGELFDRHAARLLLSGLGLNTELNFTTAPLADHISHVRAFPLPHKALIWPGGGHQMDGRGFVPVRVDDRHAVTVQGAIYQLSPVYIRLMGSQKQTTVTIHTDPGGKFRAQLIPVPVNYQPHIAVPEGYWPRVAFDTPMPVQFRTGEAIRVSGTVSRKSLSGSVDFIFENGLREIKFQTPITHGRFNRTLFFYPDEAGIYTLSITVAKWHGTAVFNSMSVVKGDPPSPDFDSDGTVGFPDFIMFAQAFGKSWRDEDFEPWFDLNLDGEVGFSDFLIFGKAFGL